MLARKWLIRGAITLPLLVVFFLHAGKFIELRLIEQLENLAYDARVRITMPNTPDERVVIVDIDEASIRREGHWPWTRDRLGLMVDQLFDRYGIRALGFDITFPEPQASPGADLLDDMAAGPLGEDSDFIEIYENTRKNLEYDAIFAESLKNRPIVLGYVFRQTQDEDGRLQTGMLPSPLLRKEQNPTRVKFQEATGFTANHELLQQAAISGGFFDNPVVSSDGSFRRTPAIQSWQGDLYSTLSLELVRAAHGWPPLQFVFQEIEGSALDNIELEFLRVGDFDIPVDADGAMLVPYRGPAYSFHYVSAADVIAGQKEIPELRDAIVLVGTSAAGLYDFRVTPVSERFNGVEVHANLVSGILEQRLKYNPLYVEAVHQVILVLLAVLLTLVMARLTVLPAIGISVALVLALFGGVMWAWNTYDFVLPIASPVLFAFLLFVFQMLYGLLIESRGKRQLSSMFGQYVPPELVAEMDANPGALALEGESREMTVLFSDVRGFTSISESLAPQELTRLMNEFLTPLTRIIHERRGTIDKYMGDAVMAFWGAPLPDNDHATHAVEAAMDMVAAMKRLQPEFRKKGWPELTIGVGLNTGIMNVGNMGSEFRMAYTVLGDAVNLGSRLEGLTKSYGVDVLVSQAVREQAPEFAFLELDIVRVKGKEQPVAIYEPLGRREQLDKELKSLRTRHKQALLYYRQQNWDSAEREFFTLASAMKDRRIYTIYLERIAWFRQHPPGADWDGVFTHTSK